MRIFRGHTIRRNLLLLVIFAVLPSLVIILYSGLSQRNEVIRESQTQILNLAIGIRDLQIEKAERAYVLLSTLGGLPEFKTQSYEKCTTLLKQVLKDNSDLANVVYLDISGIVRASGKQTTEQVDASDRKFFRESLQQRVFSAGEFTVGRISNIPIFQFGFPVFNPNGEIVGVLSASYELNKYGNFLRNIQLLKGSRAILLDSKGIRLFVYSPDTVPPQVGTMIRKENWETMSSTKEDQKTFLGIRSDNVECFFSFAKIRLHPELPPYMYVQVNIPVESVLKGARATLYTSILLLCIAAIFALITARIVGNIAIVHEYNIVEKNNAYNRSLIEASLDPLVAIDSEGIITDANTATEVATGYARNELIGTDFSSYFTDSMKAKSGYRQVFHDGFVKDYELELLHKNGSSIPVLYNATIYKNELGEPSGIFAAARDISERKKAEELRMDIERIVQHDLRAPASSAVIVSKLLADSPGISDSDRDLLVKLSHSGQLMLDILNQSLDIYKINSGSYQLALKSFDILALIQEVSESLLLLPSFLEKKVDVYYNGSSCKSVVHGYSIDADFNLLRLALQNLIQNGLEASREGGSVTIEITSGSGCKIEIKNNKVVPKEIRGRFFEKYVTSGKKFGTGIGTYSAKLMIEAQGGTIEMHTSDERNETVVTITLPERSEQT